MLHVDIYRILLVKKNSGAYNIKFWAPGIFVLLYCKHYNDSLAPTPNGRLWKFSLIMPKYFCPTALFIYEFHNKNSYWGHSKAIGFWPYVLAFKATAPKTLLSTDLDFFDQMTSLCHLKPPKCYSRSPNIFYPGAPLIARTIFLSYDLGRPR